MSKIDDNNKSNKSIGDNDESNLIYDEMRNELQENN